MAGQPQHGTRRAQEPAGVQPERRAYVAPQLIEYGTVAKLTQTGGVTEADFAFNLRRMM
ncbi:MAG TPA: lasso RiPP family leader peptide-containing protein [Vicinamibacterales bacterium]|nr:lasso RiPP family leader peptide-containing protein [Vicinamibacterales bacterium]